MSKKPGEIQMASSKEKFADFFVYSEKKIIKQLLNLVLAEYEELLRPRSICVIYLNY